MCLSFQKMYPPSTRSCDPHNEICALPYSSGTTGPPKGVSLTHYNFVANMAQVGAPGLNDLQVTSEDHQDVSIALLPFFHIYAMTTVMSMGLHYGLKLVTLPKFEPETYLKALVQYKVRE